MKQVANLKKLNNLSYFDTSTISQITETKGDTLYQNISRWEKQGLLLKLKKGMYTTQTYMSNQENKNYFLEFMSNQLRYPSYLSTEYVLSKNQILTQSVFTYSSITLKSTRNYSNALGRFVYQTIKPELFTGFDIIEKTGYKIAQATKPKALFDYIYLKFFKIIEPNEEMIEELRLNLDEFSPKDIKEFRKYCNLSNIQKYPIISDILFKKNDN